jgi:4-alpha-glucanotransferase
MELYGLGRFRVTQKADLDNELDVYRSENAQPEDWLMLGNHDTAPIWQVADNWLATGNSHRQAEYLATRLHIPAAERARWIGRVSVDAGALVQAKFADLLVGPAHNIMVFFTDLLGSKETYNKPGTMSVENWTLRIPSNYKSIYTEKLTDNHALDIARGLATALRARGFTTTPEHRQLIRELEDF